MAKRRFRADSGEDKAPESLTPEERRARRREERGRSSRAKKPKEPRTGWRRAVVPSIVVATIIVVVLVVFFGVGNFFTQPCLALKSIPESSGIPNFPASNTTDFTGTWCPVATTLFSVHPKLQISINGQSVGLPPSIGRSQNFTNYECVLPLHTEPGVSGGVFNVTDPWGYEYTLGDFFSVWQSSYVSAFVNSSYSTRTIDYTSSSLLGLPADASHRLTLFVDNQVSSDGPNLILDTLDNQGGSNPSCIDSIHGTGHVIALVYSTIATHAFGPSAPVGGHATALAPSLAPTVFDPTHAPLGGGDAPSGPPAWLVLRVAT